MLFADACSRTPTLLQRCKDVFNGVYKLPQIMGMSGWRGPSFQATHHITLVPRSPSQEEKKAKKSYLGQCGGF